MDQTLAIQQALRFAEELTELHARERAERRRAEHALSHLEASYAATVGALGAALELRDDATGEHAGRVNVLALALARIVAPELASDPHLEYGFLLHDIGKIGVPDAVLLKPGPLDEAERALIRRHPTLGEQIVEGVPHLAGLAREVIGAHHERWDGGGYPRGLRGDEIPLAARIFSIADTFDAITNDRPYRLARGVAEAIDEIESQSGRQFDPALVRAFVRSFDEVVTAA
jgi:ribonuclease P protein subunit RPR2